MVKAFELPEVLKPKISPLVVDGRVHYSERSRANSIILLKKQVLAEFSELTSTPNVVKYRMEYFRYDYKSFAQRVVDIMKARKGVPFLLFLYTEDKSDEC